MFRAKIQRGRAGQSPALPPAPAHCRMNAPLLLLAALLALAQAGCRKEAAPAPAKISLAPPPTATVESEASPAPSPPFSPDVSGTAVAPYQQDLESKSADEQLRGLNGVLSFWLATGRPFPKDLNELVAAKLVPRLPAPPPGRQFALSWCDQKETGLCDQKENNAWSLLSPSRGRVASRTASAEDRALRGRNLSAV